MFRFEFMSLTQLGTLFGATNQQVGKWLTELQLRTSDGKPSSTAFTGNFVEQMPSRNGGYAWAWHAEITVAALESAGHYRLVNPPLGLVEPLRLHGPFSSRNLHDGSYQIVCGDGRPAIVVAGERNASFVLRLLNLAHDQKVIEKHLGASAS